MLPNGNIVVIDPQYSRSTDVSGFLVGAVYLYDGATLTLISRLTGSTIGDLLGQDSGRNLAPIILKNGNFIVSSPGWQLPGVVGSVGAITWINGTTGLSGTVGPANSIILRGEVTALASGNYVVSNLGKATWYNGLTGRADGLNERFGAVTPLPNGHYLVSAPGHSGGAGAVFFCDGTTGKSRAILEGTQPGDHVGSGGITILANSNYVVWSPSCHAGAGLTSGAVTWCNGTTGLNGTVSVLNSLVGSPQSPEGATNSTKVYPLANGNYVVAVPYWNQARLNRTQVGAVTWCNGVTGRVGVISEENSLVGNSANDQTGFVRALSNGNYVVATPGWDNPDTGIVDVGAVTWCDGATGRVGTITSANSLIGTAASDSVGRDLSALQNGNYAVISPDWDYQGLTNVGAVTWCDGATGRRGIVSADNSLIGSAANDAVGGSGITALAKGNYVVLTGLSPTSAEPTANAATWCDGRTGLVGTINETNSVVGYLEGGLERIQFRPLDNGNYFLLGSFREFNGAESRGSAALRFGDGTRALTGRITSSNSFVFDHAQPLYVELLDFSPNYCVFINKLWKNPIGPIVDAGSITFLDATRSTVGEISAENSLLGTETNDLNQGPDTLIAFDRLRSRFVVGQPKRNRVTLFTPPSRTEPARVILHATRESNGITLLGPVGPGQTLSIEYSPTLALGGWLKLGNAGVTNGMGSFQDHDAGRLSLPVGYYRGSLLTEPGP